MKQSSKYLFIAMAITVSLTGCSWFGSENGLKKWRKLGNLVSFSQIKNLPKKLQSHLQELKTHLYSPSGKPKHGTLQKSVASLLKTDRTNMFSLTSSGTASNTISNTPGDIGLQMKDIGQFTFVLLFDDNNEHTDDWLVEIAKRHWTPPAHEALGGKRYLYQLPSRMAYTIRMNKIIQERNLTQVSTPDSHIVIFNNDLEPTDDNSSFCAKWAKSDGETTFSELRKRAQENDKTALKLISEMMQVIYFAGLWNVHARDVLFINENKVVFVDHETPGLGGNPWLQLENGQAPIKPWLPLNKKGEQTLKGSGKYGVRQLWELLFNFPKDTLFRDKSRVEWFGKYIEHDILEQNDFLLATIKNKIDKFLETHSTKYL